MHTAGRHYEATVEQQLALPPPPTHPNTPLPEVRSGVLAMSLFGLSSGWVSGVDLHHVPPGTLHCLAQFEGKAALAASGRRFFWSQTEVMRKLSKCE